MALTQLRWVNDFTVEVFGRHHYLDRHYVSPGCPSFRANDLAWQRLNERSCDLALVRLVGWMMPAANDPCPPGRLAIQYRPACPPGYAFCLPSELVFFSCSLTVTHAELIEMLCWPADRRWPDAPDGFLKLGQPAGELFIPSPPTRSIQLCRNSPPSEISVD